MFGDKGQKMARLRAGGQDVPVRVEINPRARRLILRLDERSREAVAVAPSRRDVPAALAFAEERADWIVARLDALPEETPFAPGASIPLRGESCRLAPVGTGRLPKLRTEPELLLEVPGDASGFAGRVERYLKRAARSDLSDAVLRHCERLGVAARRITVKDTRSRWGSCTADGRLAFSWRLICAPPDVLDYVAAHECAHLLEMNHSATFWAHVERCRPDWQMQRAWLRRHGRALHAIGGS